MFFIFIQGFASRRGPMPCNAMRSPSAYSAASTRVLSAKYDSELRMAFARILLWRRPEAGGVRRPCQRVACNLMVLVFPVARVRRAVPFSSISTFA